MKNYLANWNMIRLIRLAMGIIITVNGALTHEWMILILGGLFTLMAILNINTCATGSCTVPRTKRRI
ncbi:hypothetical protein [Pedobacter montanisoli]|uniref:DUF2892 domain-containing protein n=1 Tax=Pedobacter montanisoli TaxID=2923277 RepID=A0ABS9ZZM5_9SPHI|nr:hypothetical protein [Pedobacter montanisoli]MCJ0743757.1 hypothetical protein [Pedobacter montanisoli]